MSQNAYDDEDFFARYSLLKRSVSGLEGAPEWPVVRDLVPDLTGTTVIDLGCGFGWFCHWASEEGAAQVTGYDLSANMLERARRETFQHNVQYVRANLESLKLPERAATFAYSSLALHYIVDLERMLSEVRGALIPGSYFLFTIEHPIYTAPLDSGWLRDAGGRLSWPVNRYAVEGARKRTWLGSDVVKQHRTVGTLINAVIGAGFTLRYVNDWSPSEEQVAQDPNLASELERPMLLIVLASA